MDRPRVQMKMIAIVTDDGRRTMTSLGRLGIGPWKIYTFDDRTVESTYKGRPHSSTLRIGIAEMPDTTWEVIEPLAGEGVHQDHLKAHGESFLHVALDFGPANFSEGFGSLEGTDFEVVQSATWLGRLRYAFLKAADSPGVMIEVVHAPEDFVFPEPEEWFGLAEPDAM